MSASDCGKIDDKIEQAPTRDSYSKVEKRWSRLRDSILLPGPDSIPVLPKDDEGFDTAATNTDPEAPVLKYQEQGIQCDFDEKEEKKEKKVQTPTEESLPSGRRLAILLVCACTAIFLQALVGQWTYRL